MFCPCELKSSTLTKENGVFYRELVFVYKTASTPENPDASIDAEIRMKVNAQFIDESHFLVGESFDFYPNRFVQPSQPQWVGTEPEAASE